MLKVRDVMTREPVTVLPTTPIKDVARLLIQHDISGMPVVGEGAEVVGVVSEGDLIVREQGADAVARRPLARIFGESRATRAQRAKALALTAGDAMTTPAVTIGPDAFVAEAAATMTRRQVNRLPVIDGGSLVGVVSRADVVRAFGRTDEEVAETVRRDVLSSTLWLDPGTFDVAVTNGNLRIRGEVERWSEADLIERISAMVPGVTGITTDVTWKFDDREIEAPGRDLVSPYGAGAGRRRTAP